METQLKLMPKRDYKTSASGWTWPSAITDMNKTAQRHLPSPAHHSPVMGLSHGRSLDGKRWGNSLGTWGEYAQQNLWGHNENTAAVLSSGAALPS